jgi:PAS domain S-box-containing protein
MPQGKIIFVNDAFTRATGYTLAEIAGQTPRILKSGEHPPGYYKQLWKTITAGEVFEGLVDQQAQKW